MKKFAGVLLSLSLFLGTIAIRPMFAVGQATAPESVESRVDKLFAEWDKWDSPGASIAVLKDGAVVFKKGYGSAQLEYDIPITPATIFHVASVSKEFTAFAVAMLAEQGKLAWDDDVRKYIPEVPDFGKTITLRHLVHHTSGLRDQWELLAMAGWRQDDVITREHILKMVARQRNLNFAPGDEYLYCNTGFTLLAEVVARVTGQTFAKWTEENIFKPLGMSNTHFHDDHEMIVRNMAYSYSPGEGGGFKKSILSFANVGATSLFTTVEDLSRWIQNFFDARVGGPDVLRQVQEPGVLNNGKKIDYAFGLVVGEHKGLKTVGHGGSDAGYRSSVVWFPEQRLGVAVLCNLGSTNPGALSLKAADLYLDEAAAPGAAGPAAAAEPVRVPRPVLESYVGKYQLTDGPVVGIIREGASLAAEIAGVPKLELVAESERTFRLKAVDALLTFEKDKSGKISRFVFSQGGETTSAERLAPPVLSGEALEGYAGTYSSPELATAYTLEVRDGTLVARHPRNEDAVLSPTEADGFSGDKWYFGKVRFTRDADGSLTGFLLSGGRVRNLRFVKD